MYGRKSLHSGLCFLSAFAARPAAWAKSNHITFTHLPTGPLTIVILSSAKNLSERPFVALRVTEHVCHRSAQRTLWSSRVAETVNTISLLSCAGHGSRLRQTLGKGQGFVPPATAASDSKGDGNHFVFYSSPLTAGMTSVANRRMLVMISRCDTNPPGLNQQMS